MGHHDVLSSSWKPSHCCVFTRCHFKDFNGLILMIKEIILEKFPVIQVPLRFKLWDKLPYILNYLPFVWIQQQENNMFLYQLPTPPLQIYVFSLGWKLQLGSFIISSRDASRKFEPNLTSLQWPAGLQEQMLYFDERCSISSPNTLVCIRALIH